MSNEQQLKSLIKEKAAGLQLAGTDIEGEVLLAAICYGESTFGRNNQPRREPAYCPGGVYYENSEEVQEAYARFGQDAACSWGPWQILFITARELGYDGEPQALTDPQVTIDWVIKFINKRILARGCKTLEKIADAYNSGSCKDAHVPSGYIRKLVSAYHGLAREWLHS